MAKLLFFTAYKDISIPIFQVGVNQQLYGRACCGLCAGAAVKLHQVELDR